MADHETEPAAKRRCLPEPVSKHPIFLSHSGNEKAFAEQLCEDLKRMNHYPFFDQDYDSLPKGERFPSLIFSAAEECLLAVVVVSEGYLSSKWPMLELSTFVKSMKGGNPHLKLFPVFFKLSPSDISAERVETQWRESWEKLVQEGKVSAEDIALWSDAVRELRAFNGVEFSKYGTSEVRYRAAVVEEICISVPPMMKYKTDDIRGYERLCEVTSTMFEEGTSREITCREGCYYLGLYGLGGVGKSTLCKAMCSFFQNKYGSRVCYVELPSDAEKGNTEKGRISRIKSVLQELTGLDKRSIDRIISEFQGLECLRNRLRDQPAVFLAVDNVGDLESSRDEARGLVKTVLATGSKVMVSSRSRSILKSIFDEKYCKPISRLEMDEARELFLSVAVAPKKLLCGLQPVEDEIVEACLRECQFAEDGYSTRQYHPLVLRALGSYFHDVDNDNIMKWEDHKSVQNKLQKNRESKQVNEILGLNYSSLSDAAKMVFLDVALLINVWFKSVYENPDSGVIVGSNLEVRDYKWRVSFIATLHGISRIDVERELKELQRKSLIYEDSPTLKMHDLYSEFAKSLVKEERSIEKEWWVHSTNLVGMNFSLMKRFCVRCEKVPIFHHLEQGQQLERLECLMVGGCEAPNNFILDLGCLKCLRVLVLESVRGMVEIVCSRSGDGDEGCLQELRFAWLHGFDLKRIPFLRECSKLRLLSIDVWEEELVGYIHSIELKIFEKLKALEELCLRYYIDLTEMPFEGLFNCTSSLKALRFLDFDFGSNVLALDDDYEDLETTMSVDNVLALDDDAYEDLETTMSVDNVLVLDDDYEDLETTMSVDVSPLGSLPMLSALSLCLRDELDVQGLDQLSGLSTLVLRSQGSIPKGVDQLFSLTTLVIDFEYGHYLGPLPNLARLPNLREICVRRCCIEDFTRTCSNYAEVKHHTNHQCHQLVCNCYDCKRCIDCHWRSGVTCQVDMQCHICEHLEFNPQRCDWSDCLVCGVMR